MGSGAHVSHKGLRVIANKERQEISLTVKRDDTEKVYILKMTTTASVALEKRLGRTTGEVMKQIGKFSVSDSRDVIHALLQKYHGKDFPPTEKGLEAVNDLIDDAGGIVSMMALIAEAVGLQKEDAGLAESGPNPPAAQAGTGDASTSSGDVAA
jgi:hypothetical protein